MILSDLSRVDLRARLHDPGISLVIGPFAARLGTSCAGLVESVGLLYADFPVNEQVGIFDFDARVDPASHAWGRLTRQACCRVDGERKFKPFPRRLALPHFEWCINWCIFSRPNQFLILHSAVLERGGRALLLTGRPGAGKSTLAAGLALRGWRLLSDEVALIRPGTCAVVPVPRPIALKNQSIEIIRTFAPGAVIGPSCPGTRKGTVAHLRPPGDSVRHCAEPAHPAWIVFLGHETGAATSLQLISRAEGLLRLGDNAFNYSMHGSTGFETLAGVIDESRCFELHYGDLREAVATLDRLATRGLRRAARTDVAAGSSR